MKFANSSFFTLITLCILTFSTITASAQQASRSKVIDLAADSAFDQIASSLHKNGYFLANLDRASGFIQVQIVTKYTKKMLSAKSGARRTLNFLVKPNGKAKAQINLNIFLEERFFGGDIHNRSYYYAEKELLEDPTEYQRVWEELAKSMDDPTSEET
ncbi:hypothetical protein FAZ19_21585 [Sphingobacterium alkalisoli]|uniref:DUF4468 domain-containing protein n=1 Tax=Sphingobacterium alkalisoli TaxID=1874115 RepID=A0A4U0GRG2_9SPHI|nr:hypothetical protein [Sphingobacterium alkalisoli]TJY61493.1 hypothetical protein FAZ19_21585 [Sphingobacterium alkalisoli]GGH30052.1 hypothetical protein GCM10011418_41810 [Sphingobacterium alkalisoli]